MSELNCSSYAYYDDPNLVTPCRCPVCGGFLKWVDDEPICNKCGVELLAIPERDEYTGEELEWGKICPISLLKKEKVTPKVEDDFVIYSDVERETMREHGLCVTCDFDKTCQIRQHHLSITSSWRAHGDTAMIPISARNRSKHPVRVTIALSGSERYGDKILITIGSEGDSLRDWYRNSCIDGDLEPSEEWKDFGSLSIKTKSRLKIGEKP